MTDEFKPVGPLDPFCEMVEVLTEMTPLICTLGLGAGGRATATVVITEDAGGDLEPNCCRILFMEFRITTPLTVSD